ncbi:uncharacterized protein [Elaeis guineensis]|uniref:uncharacterized protein n=1 Tax=Elaeis guineensis var. tenera TaxID=51953 RepID=UPI003C6D6C5E
MTLLTWNIRGLGERPKRRIVKDFLDMNHCGVIGLRKTKLENPSTVLLKSISGGKISRWLLCNAVGSAGGIFVGWDGAKFDLIKDRIEKFSITTHWFDRSRDFAWSFTCVYGPTDRNLKKSFWKELTEIHSSLNGPWILGGDFNATVEDHDRNNPEHRKCSKAFRALIRTAHLVDLPLKGQRFTWSNHREYPILAKLDRFLITTEMDDRCPNAFQEALSNPCLDHVPILLSLSGLKKPSSLFRFDRAGYGWMVFRRLSQEFGWSQDLERMQ